MQPNLQDCPAVFIRLGRASKGDIEILDSLNSSPIESIKFDVKCTQVPSEAGPGSLALVCLGSDNNKGTDTPWTRGLRGLGVITTKSGGPNYNDEWTVGVSIGVVLPRSLSQREFILEARDLYPHFMDMPIIGAGSGAQQTVQIASAGKLEALLTSLCRVFPGTKDELIRKYPELAHMTSFKPPSTSDQGDGLTSTNPFLQRLIELLQKRRNVILYGPPGTGKTHLALNLSQVWRENFGSTSVLTTTFHPSYSYELFVEGFRPADQASPGEFLLTDGVLKKACERARQLPCGDLMLLLIDEINRGDVARIFGELITYIEPSKRDIEFTLSHRPDGVYSIPSNLCILGTMNTADKSVSLLDVALRRRFAFVELAPDPTAYDSISSWKSEINGIRLGDLLMSVNRRLEGIGIPTDRVLGHSLLQVDSTDPDPVSSLLDRLELDVFPLVEEYCYFDRSRVVEVLGGLVDDAGRWKKSTTVVDSFNEIRKLLSSNVVSTPVASRDDDDA